MKGLDLAELFFQAYGLPAIQEHFAEMVDRVAAGLIGLGSEVIGADDELSRDHGWGPRFTLFLTEDDFLGMGEEVEAQLNELRPPVFEGVNLSLHRTDPITVSTVDQCFRELTGLPRPPASAREWAFANENGLCFAQGGRVFYDPLGELTARKAAFEKAYYPEAIWWWRVASKLFRLWHYGSYNLCDRLAARGDGVAALVGQGHFVEAAMQLAFLLNRRFAPYWKWLHWAFVRLPSLAGELEPLLVELESSSRLTDRAERIDAICGFYRAELCDQGIFPDKRRRGFMGSFEIVDKRIRDPEVKRLVGEYFHRYRHL